MVDILLTGCGGSFTNKTNKNPTYQHVFFMFSLGFFTQSTFILGPSFSYRL